MKEVVEQESFEWLVRPVKFPVGPAWIPWASQEYKDRYKTMPSSYFMAIFDLQDLRK